MIRGSFFATLFEEYRKLVFVAFMIILCGTFCFARAFSVQKMGFILGVPLYITDVFIIVGLPLAFLGLKRMGRVSSMFCWPFRVLFLFGMFYLLLGLMVYRSEFALRGVVLSTYLMFLPLVWVFFEKGFNERIFYVVLGACDLIAVFNGAFYGSSEMRAFNIMLYCSIAVAFFFSYGMEKAKSFWQWLIWALCGINIALIVTSGVRSAWVAVISLMLFYIFIFRASKKKLFLTYGVIFLFVLCFVQIQSFLRPSRMGSSIYVERAAGTAVFVTEKLALEQFFSKIPAAISEQPLLEISKGSSIAYDNITWRIKVWKATWHAGMRSPVWGHGFSRVLVYDASITTDPVRGFADNSGITPPHNEFLTIFYKMGFLGLALFLWINGFVFVQGVKALRLCEQGMHRACLTGALGGLVVWHAMAQFFDLIDSPPTNIFLWMLLGLVLVLVYGQKDRSVKETT
jgi:hypothetical protein